MMGEKEFIDITRILQNIQKNYKKIGRLQVLIDHAHYISLIRKAAYKGNIEAQYDLALNYEDQNYFVPNPMYNKKRRFYWYVKAANAGHPEACNNLANLYENGNGTKKDLKKALFFYKKSYELGCSYAKKNYKILLNEIEKKSNG